MPNEESVLPDNTGGKTKSFASLILGKVHTLDTGKKSAPLNPTPVHKIEIPEPKVKTPESQSQKAREDILRRARQNQDHYLLTQLEDNSKKPWFMYPKYDYQYSEFVLINPEMAQAMIDRLWLKEEGNRNLKVHLMEAYQRDIRNDHWIPTDESIGINLSFEVYNGQHRLQAIIAEGKEMPMYITWNVLDEAKFFIESGAIRSLSERLKMVVDPELGNRTSGFCKAIMRGVAPRVKFTNSDVAEFAYKWQSLIKWIAEHYPIGRAEVQAALAKAYLWYGSELIEPFCLRLREIKFQDTGDPARALYVSLQASKKNRSNITLSSYKKTLQAIDALVEERPVSKLHEKNEDIFQWLPGWDVPPKPTKKK